MIVLVEEFRLVTIVNVLVNVSFLNNGISLSWVFY